MPAGLHTFYYEVEKAGDPIEGRVAKVICHGSLINQTSGNLRDAVKLLISDGGHITLDFQDVSLVDSLGLGTLVGLKVSSIDKGRCTLEVENLQPRVQELLRMTNLMEMFTSSQTEA
jgi:anti-anti-sigma factor